jgi:hypothetical protein
VQDALIDEMIEEIVDQIFNGTVANWWYIDIINKTRD